MKISRHQETETNERTLFPLFLGNTKAICEYYIRVFISIISVISVVSSPHTDTKISAYSPRYLVGGDRRINT
jgi:hypothetical protein